MVLPRPKLARKLAARSALPKPPDPNSPSWLLKAHSPEQDVRAACRLITKAERDERIDITLALTPPKQFRPGFTQPRQLRVASWFPGGSYNTQRKDYWPPPDTAYEPHTVFLLEARHPVRHGLGRIDSRDHIIGVCREADLPAVMRKFNSDRAPGPAREAMDNARWPWILRKSQGRVVWWQYSEHPHDVRREVWYGDSPDDASVKFTTTARPSVSTRATAANQFVPLELLQSSPKSNALLSHRRAFHSSARRSDDEPSTSARDRTAIPGSSWSRPPKPSQDADDHVVPTYYIERKRQRDSISERKEEEGGLMAELSAGILSEDVAVRTRTRDEKIPVEVRGLDGVSRHPSGFEPPTAETDFHPVAAKVATEDHPMIATIKQVWGEQADAAIAAGRLEDNPSVRDAFVNRKVQETIDTANVLAAERASASTAMPYARGSSASSNAAQRRTIPTSSWDTPARSTMSSTDPDTVVPPFYIERKKQRDAISDRKDDEAELMYELSEGILADDVAAHHRVRHGKIPVEVEGHDGVMRHPSGFEPPTAETDFHPISAKPAEAPPKSLWTEVPSLKGVRRFHTTAHAKATEVSFSDLPSITLANPPPAPIASHVSARQPKHKSYKPFHTIDDDAYDNDDFNVDPFTRDTRERYRSTLASKPFWRPLMTLSFATRPLAMSVARLARSRERGIPYYSTLTLEDRLCHHSYTARMRNMRLDRFTQLAVRVARLLRGERGGIVGLRFRSEQFGRGVGGESLEAPLPDAQRTIRVGIAAWYERRAELMRVLAGEADAAELDVAALDVSEVDERGRRMDGAAMAKGPKRHLPRPAYDNWTVNTLAQRFEPAYDFAAWDQQRRRGALEEVVGRHLYGMAMALAAPHARVVRP